MIELEEVKRVEAGAERVTADVDTGFAESADAKRIFGISSANDNSLKRVAQEKRPKVLTSASYLQGTLRDTLEARE